MHRGVNSRREIRLNWKVVGGLGVVGVGVFLFPPPLALSVPQAAARLGTAHGEREYSYVQDTQFERLQPEPNEVIRIRYDSLQNLVAMGIVRRPRTIPGTLDPFPGSHERQFVPDPPG